jgi:H+/Cl- antiporter ClcA
MIGMFTGLISFTIIFFEDLLLNFKINLTQTNLVGTESNSFHPMAYFVWLVFSLICAGVAGALTIYVAPKATGSGIPELMGMLNGVEIPDFLSYKVLFVKVVGVCLAVAATLCIGKEGPLAHIGAMVAVLTIYLPISWMKQF